MSATDPRILVFQHIAVEHPGVFRDFMREDGVEWRAVELDAGESIPDPGDYDALWVMGGPDGRLGGRPPSVARGRARRHPGGGHRAEAALPRFLLGHQLLAQALGGEVGPAAEPEVGIFDVELTEAGGASPLFEGVPATHACLQEPPEEDQDADDGGLREGYHVAGGRRRMALV